MESIPVLVEIKVTARERPDWNEKLVMKTGMKQGTKVDKEGKPGLDEQGRNIN